MSLSSKVVLSDDYHIMNITLANLKHDLHSVEYKWSFWSCFVIIISSTYGQCTLLPEITISGPRILNF